MEEYTMLYVSEIKNSRPKSCKTDLQEKVFDTLELLKISYERVDSDEVITMQDCTAIDEKLNMKMVKTLFLCNRQKSNFFLLITCGNKAFSSKEFSKALGISRVSFAPAELMNEMLQTKIGAATIFSTLVDPDQKINVIMDKDVLKEEYYGCSDGTTTGYMKIHTKDITNTFLPFTKHKMTVISI
jgi:Ala-tRNA(Pro) deacylase